MPKISVVCPVYAGDAYLSETLESLRNQTEKDIEMIVVNDASPDYLDDLMNWYVKQDSRIKYHLFETNQGVCSARNFGNEKAESDLILVSDQDDLSSPQRAEVSIAFMNEHTEIDCITSAYFECDVDGKPIREYQPEDMTREVFERGGFVWFHSSACYRKKDIIEFPYRDLSTGVTDDWQLLEDWTKAGKRFKTLLQTLGYCRRLPGGVMSQRRAIQGMAPNYVL